MIGLSLDSGPPTSPMKRPNRPVWTFVVRGGSLFALQMPNHPILDHDGDQTIWKGYVTSDESDSIVQAVEEAGASVIRYIEQESTDQHYERQVMMGKYRDQTVFQTVRCPACFWFDPMLPSQCGLDDWEPVVIKAALTNPTAPSDREKCPLNK